jgi:hypothetical protein
MAKKLSERVVVRASHTKSGKVAFHNG